MRALLQRWKVLGELDIHEKIIASFPWTVKGGKMEEIKITKMEIEVPQIEVEVPKLKIKVPDLIEEEEEEWKKWVMRILKKIFQNK